jgi:hypothetical protein
VEHMRAQGFDVKTHDVEDVPGSAEARHARRLRVVPHGQGRQLPHRGACPGGGCPAPAEREAQGRWLGGSLHAAGLPGMESAKPMPYETLLVKADGSTSVFARH